MSAALRVNDLVARINEIIGEDINLAISRAELQNPTPKIVAIENTFVENNIPLVKSVNKMAMMQLPIKDFSAKISVLPMP